MIVEMHKVSVLCAQKERDAALRQLYELGVVHLQSGSEAADGDLAAARSQLQRLDDALAVIGGNDGATAAATVDGIGDANAVADRAHALAGERAECQRTLAGLALERAALLPFGDFDPAAITALAGAGVAVQLLRHPVATPPALPTGVVRQVLSEQDGLVAIAVVGPADLAQSVRGLQLPERGLAAVESAIAAATARSTAIDGELAALATARPRLRGARAALLERVELLTARASMAGEGELAWITGFCPADRLPQLRAEAQTHGMVVVARAVTGDDVVPTLLRGPQWVRQVHAVFEGIGIMPGYTEADVSPVFLVFLLVFAAMLIGDAGYGALLLCLSLFLWRKTGRGAGGPPQAVRLLTTMSVATMAWGAITGTWFAIARGTLPAAFDGLRIAWLAGDDPVATSKHVMLFCFLLGAIHLTLAHLWAALRAGKSLQALAQFGWIASTWLMFALADKMVLNDTFPSFMTPVAIVGIALIVLFMTPLKQLKNEWFNHVMLPLSLVSNFVDVVSYLRLFAVGTAGVAVASSFNDMAAKAAQGGGSGWLLAIFVTLFGHTLNLLLCAMGVLVHGVRLNTLEFSAHLGLQWGGVAYRPFGRRAPPGGPDGANA